MTSLTAVAAPVDAGTHGFFDGFGWSQGAVIIGAVIAAAIAVIGYANQRKIVRRSERADLYGNAIGAVEAYLEGPYRIRRKTENADNWFALSSALSDVKTAISHHEALLEMHAPPDVVNAFKEFSTAAIREAGTQMTAAWGATVASAPTEMSMGTAYLRTDADSTRAQLVKTMTADLKAITTWWRIAS